MKILFTVLVALLICVFTLPTFASSSNANIVSIVASTTNITTAAYVTLSASTPVGTQKFVVANGTAQNIIIAQGAAGSERGLIAVGAGTSAVVPLSYYIPAASRLSDEAIGATASTGTISVSLLP
jgi:hypothetical protein